MSESTTVRLWDAGIETEKAYKYFRIPPERNPDDCDVIWIPKSIVEGRTKRGNEHEVKLPDWFTSEHNL